MERIWTIGVGSGGGKMEEGQLLHDISGGVLRPGGKGAKGARAGVSRCMRSRAGAGVLKLGEMAYS